MTLRSASSLPDELSSVSARLLRRTLVLAALTAALPAWADAPAQAASTPAAEAPSTLTVKAGQSLNDLAFEVTQSHDKSVLARVGQALFQANPRAFMKHDPSLLMVGATLQVPADAATGGAAVAASGASSATAASAASSPAPGASAAAVTHGASTVPAAAAASATTAAAASASTATQPASDAATASEATGAGTMANNASASAEASAPASASGNSAASGAGAGAAASAATAALAGVKQEMDEATKAWNGLGDDVRTGVLAVLAAVALLLVGLVLRSRRRARAGGKVEPFVAPSAARMAAAMAGSDTPRAAAEAVPVAPAVPATDASSTDATPEAPTRSAAAQALARAMGTDPDEAQEVGELPQAAPAAEPIASIDAPKPAEASVVDVPAAASAPVETQPTPPASERIVPQEMFSYHTKMVGRVMPVTGAPASASTAQAETPAHDIQAEPPVAQFAPAVPVDMPDAPSVHVDSVAQDAVPPQPLHTIPLDAIAALGSLDMGLPPRVSTDPVEPAAYAGHDAIAPTQPATGADAQSAHPDAAGGLGSVPFGPLDLGFDLEHSASAAGAAHAPSPEVLARIARNKLELAHEYINIGDLAGARVLTQEVIDAGHPDTREAAQALLARLKELS